MATVAYGGPWVHISPPLASGSPPYVYGLPYLTVATVRYGGSCGTFVSAFYISRFGGPFHLTFDRNISRDLGGDFGLKNSLENISKHFDYVFDSHEHYHGCYDDSPSDVQLNFW